MAVSKFWFNYYRSEDDCFNLGSVDLVRHMCKECTLANSYTSYHPLFKYSRGKGSILASESLLSSVTMFYKIKKPSVSTRFLPLETIVVMSLTYSIKNPSSKWRFPKHFALNSTDYTGYSDLIYKLLSDNDIADILNISCRQIWKLIHDIKELYRLKRSTHYD